MTVGRTGGSLSAVVNLENNAITFFLNTDQVSVPLQCVFLESGFYTVHAQKVYDHPRPPFNRLFLFSSGGGQVWYGNREILLESEVIYLLPKNLQFRVTYRPTSDFYYFHFLLEDQFKHDVFERTDKVCTIQDKPELCSDITSGYILQDVRGPIGWQAAMFRAVMLLGEAQLETAPLQSHKSMRYGEILRHIQMKGTATLKVSDLAELMKLSTSALSKAFSRDFGMSLKEYLIQSLMHRARQQLITSDKTVTEIAYGLGYDDPAYFSRVFRSHMLETPSEYRRQVRAARIR